MDRDVAATWHFPPQRLNCFQRCRFQEFFLESSDSSASRFFEQYVCFSCRKQVGRSMASQQQTRDKKPHRAQTDDAREEDADRQRAKKAKKKRDKMEQGPSSSLRSKGAESADSFFPTQIKRSHSSAVGCHDDLGPVGRTAGRAAAAARPRSHAQVNMRPSICRHNPRTGADAAISTSPVNL